MRRPDRAGLPADSAKEHEAPSAELAADPEAGHSWKESIGHSGSERPKRCSNYSAEVEPQN
ncbi:unnamed protein product [Prorocentrum cordatum]|uniref:Uncharacterized protein n=1 Tax=Prorocentrum cordatum TaxID=2364126 RepID=A0ABN9W6S1_9DINO|nr:unnamed protein product [Polarella glacialis]